MRLAPWRAGAPLFLRVFLLMLLCVGAVQLMNVVLVIAVQAPTQKVYTVGQLADAIRAGGDPAGEIHLAALPAAPPSSPWNPRAERATAALSTALDLPPDRVRLWFPPAFLQRQPIYDRRRVAPSPPMPLSFARSFVLLGNFRAAIRQPDGRWLLAQPDTGFEPWRWFVLIWLVVSALAVVPFAWALARRFAKPIGLFGAAAERLGRDPRAPPIALHGPPEIAEAAAAFNRMQAQLNRYVDDRTTVMGALAHDLRTPLMRLGLRLERVPDPVRGACEGDIREMQAMISATLAYVRDTLQPVERRPLELRSIAETVIDEMSDRGSAVSLAPGDPVVLAGYPVGLKMMLTNLLTNAVNYAGGAEMAIFADARQVTIEVVDRGPGMPEDDLADAFEPFFRGERSRSRDTGGLGLGLASARVVARAHGGDITLRNREGGGLAACVTLPL